MIAASNPNYTRVSSRVGFLGWKRIGWLAVLALCCASTMCSSKENPCADVQNISCDIRDLGCQENTFCLMQQIRGGHGGESPRVNTITQAEYRQLLVERLVDPTLKDEHWDRVLAMLGLLDSDISYNEALIEDLVAHVVAFYDPSIQEVFIVDRGALQEPEKQVATLAHEFVHAAQDDEFGLEEFTQIHGVTIDDYLVVQCLLEGEAVLYENLVELGLDGTSPYSVGWQEYYDTWRDIILEESIKSPFPYVSLLGSLSYPVGAKKMTSAWLFQGNEGVEQVYNEHPRDMLGWLNPDLASLPLLDEPIAPEPPAGFEAVFRDELGATFVFALLAAQGMELDDARLASFDWRFDRMWTFVDFENDHHAAEWRISWRNQEAAETFVAMASKLGVAAYVEDSSTPESTLHICNDVEILESWVGKQRIGKFLDYGLTEPTSPVPRPNPFF